MPRGRRGRELVHPEFLAVRKLSKNLLLVAKLSFKNAKFGAEEPHFGEILGAKFEF